MERNELLDDLIPFHLTNLPRICLQIGCFSPIDVELKYFNNKSKAEFSQPRLFATVVRMHLYLVE